MGTGGAIDDRRRSDADQRRYLTAGVRATGRFPDAEQRHVPQQRAAVRVERVHRVVLGGHEHHVVRRALHAERREVQRLGVHLAVGGQEAQLAEAARVHVRGRQHRLRQVLAGAGQVVLVGHDVGAGSHGGRAGLRLRRGRRAAAVTARAKARDESRAENAGATRSHRNPP